MTFREDLEKYYIRGESYTSLHGNVKIFKAIQTMTCGGACVSDLGTCDRSGLMFEGQSIRCPSENGRRRYSKRLLTNTRW